MNNDDKIILGFTGTRHGMTEAQQRTVTIMVSQLEPNVLNHGDCIGADADMHGIVRQSSPFTVIHAYPSNRPEMRAYCDADAYQPAAPPLARNRAIVADSGQIIATPYTTHVSKRGGTWYTIISAWQRNVPCRVVWPDGTWNYADELFC